jgi:hypothetical protein
MEREELEEGDEGKTTRFSIFSDQVGRVISEF